MTDAEYVEHEFRKGLREHGGSGPVETVRVKVEGPYGSSRWVTLRRTEFERMTTATVEAVSERGE